jgi:hypothetical protein
MTSSLAPFIAADEPASAPEKSRRRTYNWRTIETLREGLRDLRAAHYDLVDRYAEVCADLEESESRNVNLRDLARAAYDTAEHAVGTASAPGSPSIVAYLMVGACAIAGWEMLQSLVRWVLA